LFLETNRFNDLTIGRFNKKTRFPFTMFRFPKKNYICSGFSSAIADEKGTG